jgi:nucleoside-diphosphate-sugar epimerase
MEQTYKSRSALNGFQVIILRAGDYLDGRRTGGWFDSHIAAKINQGTLVYPGPLDVQHEWAYLPDYARAIVAVAGNRQKMPLFIAMGFPGQNMTGQQLVDSISTIARRHFTVRAMPWFMIKMMSFFSPNLKGVTEMSYLWKKPHALDGAMFEKMVPNFQRTTMRQALSEACHQLAKK